MAKAKSNRVARIDFPLGQVLDLQKTLVGVSDAVKAEVLGVCVKEAAKPAVRSIRARVQVGTWDLANLRASITAGVRVQKRKGTAKAYVGPEVGGHYKGGKRLNKSKDDLQGSSGPSRYAHLIEFGHASRNGNRVEAKPFMRPGTDQAMNAVGAAMVVGFQKGLTKVLAKHVKKISKA